MLARHGELTESRVEHLRNRDITLEKPFRYVSISYEYAVKVINESYFIMIYF